MAVGAAVRLNCPKHDSLLLEKDGLPAAHQNAPPRAEIKSHADERETVVPQADLGKAKGGLRCSGMLL